MVKTGIKWVVIVAVVLALLTWLVGLTPTESGQTVRDLWDGFVDFLRGIGGKPPLQTGPPVVSLGGGS